MFLHRLPRAEVWKLERDELIEGEYKLRVRPDKNRTATDVIYLLLLITAWVTMTVIGGLNISRGDPHLILSGVNDQGQVCGYDDPVKLQPYFYSVLTNGIGVCVSSCPTESVIDLSSTDPADYYCLYDIVAQGYQTSDYISSSCFAQGYFDVTSDCGCMIKSATVTSPLKRCRFTETVVSSQFQTQKLTGMLWTFVSDIYTAWPIIFFYGMGASILLSLAYFWVQQYLWVEEMFLFINILGLCGLFGCLCYFSYSTFLSGDVMLVKVLSVIIAGFAFVVLMFIASEFSKIQVSARILSQSFKFMDEMMPAIFEVPLCKLLGLSLFLVITDFD